MIFAENYDSQILAALREEHPRLAENLSGNVHFKRIPNDRRDGIDGYPIFAAQTGDVTILAVRRRYDGTWLVKTVCW